MADQKITELPIKNASAINLADYLLGIDAADGYQMLISDLAKKIVETYAKSTLAGSAQTLKAAIDALNGNMSSGTLPNNSDLNNVLDTSTYILTGSFTYTNIPGGATNGTLITFAPGNTFMVQMFYPGGTNLYIRRYVNSAWTAWVRFAGTQI